MTRTVLITGGSRGIGAAITRAFHNAGDQVVVASRSDSGLVDSLGPRAFFVKTDVRQSSQLKSAVEFAVLSTGRIDVLVNNAGYSAWRPLEQIDEVFLNDMLDTNLKSVFFGSQAAVDHLPSGSAIVNVSSLAGKRGSANNSVYCATKFAVNAVTQSLAKELGPRNIRVNAVCPVYVRTAGLAQALTEESSPTRGEDLTSYLEEFARNQTALGVLPSDDQVAATCVFLASSAAGAITGQCLNVDCGVLPQ